MEFNLGWNLVGVKLRRVKFGDKERKDRYIILFFIDFNLFLTSRRQIMPRKIIVFIKLIKKLIEFIFAIMVTNEKRAKILSFCGFIYFELNLGFFEIIEGASDLEETRNLTQIEFWIQFSQNFRKFSRWKVTKKRIKSHSCQIKVDNRDRFFRKSRETENDFLGTRKKVQVISNQVQCRLSVNSMNFSRDSKIYRIFIL